MKNVLGSGPWNPVLDYNYNDLTIGLSSLKTAFLA